MIAPDLKTAEEYLFQIYGHHGVGSFVCLTEMTAEKSLKDTFIRIAPGWKRKVRKWLKEQSKRTTSKFYTVNSFSEKRREARHVEPTPLAHVDADNVDIAIVQPKPNWIVETSPGNFQALYLLDRKLNAEEIQSISKERTYSMDADKGGHSPAKLLRIPGFINPKPQYAANPPMVRIMMRQSKCYSADEFLNRAERFKRKDSDVSDRAKGGVAEATAHDFQRIRQKYRRKLDARTLSRLNQGKVFKTGWTLRIGGRTYISPADDRSEIVWAITNAALDAGMTNGEAMALTIGSVFWRDRADEGRPFDPEAHLEKVLSERQPSNDNELKSEWGIDPAELHGLPVPEREWLVEDWIPMGKVTALYGDGGTGKTTLVLQLVAAAVFGSNWLGMPVKRVNSYAVLCENDGRDSHISLAAINQLYGRSFLDWQGKSLIASRSGLYTSLMDFDGERGNVTEDFQRVRDCALSINARLVVIDTIANVFTGHESDRAQVRQFMTACSRLADDTGAAVILCGHPSIQGMQMGHGYSGSTDWNNAVRSRLYLREPGEEEMLSGDQYRVLERKKSNMAAKGEKIELEWHDGCYEVVTPTVRDKETEYLRLAQTEAQKRWESGWPFAASHQAGARYMVNWLMSEFRWKKHKARQQLDEWLSSGALVEEVSDRGSKKKGLKPRPHKTT